MKKKQKTNKELFNIAVLTVITVFTWIGFDVYRTLNKKSKVQVAKKQLETINSNFDKKTLESLKIRKVVSQQEMESTPEMITLEIKQEEQEQKEDQEATPAGDFKDIDSQTEYSGEEIQEQP